MGAGMRASPSNGGSSRSPITASADTAAPDPNAAPGLTRSYNRPNTMLASSALTPTAAF